MARGLTPFGKQVRKLRIDADVTLKEMADALGVSSAYLSGVETGDRPLSENMVQKAVGFFSGRGIAATELRSIGDRMRTSVSVEALGEEEREVVAEFARRLPGLSEGSRLKIEDILARAKKGSMR
jgi:transcriptional regulator with XRE-family HTH domain